MNVIILGAGTAGMASALFLARQGHRVKLIERISSPGPVGAGILLQPSGLHVLRKLGLAEHVLERGSRVERLEGVNSKGRQVLSLRYEDLDAGLFGIGIHRGALFSLLWEAVNSEPHIQLETGIDTVHVGETSESAWVETRSGKQECDRMVVATGARSPMRPPNANVRPYSWGALWWVATSDVSPHCLTQRYRDTREMVGILPSGPGSVSGFFSIRADTVDSVRAQGLEAWKARVKALMPFAPVEGIQSMDELIFAPYFDVVAPSWNTERIVWLGDCAHATSPQLGQGANLALVDAWVLSQVNTLSEYSQRRKKHLRFYSLASRLLTPFFQSSFPVLAPIRDLIAGPLHAWHWYRRQMLESLAGWKTGIWGKIEWED